MADAGSGIKSPSNYFSFRWLYIGVTLFLWYAVITSTFFEFSYSHDGIFEFNTIVRIFFFNYGSDVIDSRLHGVFGLQLLFEPFGRLHIGGIDLPEAIDLAGGCLVLLLALLALLFVVPSSGKASDLPARRAVHGRARLTTALVIGFFTTALIACSIDILGLNDTVSEWLNDIGWLPDTTHWHPFGSYAYLSYEPDYGIAKHVSWITTVGLTLVSGVAAWAFMTFVQVGRDRYWQSERWTMILSIAGGAMMVLAMIGLHTGDTDHEKYLHLEIFLGGSYSALIVGLFVLTWAWTCRTCLFLMVRRYEKAMVDPSNPQCFACGYSLHGLTSSKCPECGTPVHPTVLNKILESQKNQAESRSTTR